MDISDAVSTLEYLFLADPAGPCLSAADANDDASVDVSDPIAILLFLFGGGPALPAPGAECGTDPTADSLGCGTTSC